MAKSKQNVLDVDLSYLTCTLYTLVNYHKVFQKVSFASTEYLIEDIRNAKKGDKISIDNNEELKEKKGIEIGHIFQLGQKYSEKLNAKFSDKDGQLKNLWMGCYGIGVTRIAQAAIEQNRVGKLCSRHIMQVAPL